MARATAAEQSPLCPSDPSNSLSNADAEPKRDAGAESTWHRLVILPCAMLQVGATAYMASHGCYQSWTNFVVTCSPWVVLLLLAWFLTLRNQLKDSPLMKDLERFLIIGWLMQLDAMFFFAAACTGQMSLEDTMDVTSLAVVRCYTVLYTASIYLYLTILVRRLEMTEAAFGQPLGAATLKYLRCFFVVLFIVGVFYVEEHMTDPKDPLLARLPEWLAKLVVILNSNSFCCIMIPAIAVASCAVLMYRSFTEVINATEFQTPHAYVKAEAAWARQCLVRMRFAVCCPAVIQFVSGLATLGLKLVIRDKAWSPDVTVAVEQLHNGLCMAVDIVFGVFIVGAFQQQRPELPACEHGHGGAGMGKSGDGGVSVARLPSSLKWENKVDELAGRSMDLAAFLDFYYQLGKDAGPMPHFRPEASTTNDVTRQVIIPRSRTEGGGVAYASTVSPDEPPRRPDRMVTHTWTSLFVDLVAAIIADALDLEEYQDVARRLSDPSSQRQALEAELEAKGVLQLRYWICAFCVNQHSSICNSMGRAPLEGTKQHERWDCFRRDSVSGKLFEVCTCAQPKVLNDSPEECELNKFDDMMSLLCQQVPHLQLLVAVDKDFDTFTRAWCVAELVQSHTSKIPLRVCLKSSKALDIDQQDLAIYLKLATLSVEECEASRPEDKRAILAKIPDRQLFDAELQMAIFGDRGLLRRSFVGFGLLEAAARSARRLKTLASRRDEPLPPASGSSREMAVAEAMPGP